MPCGLWRHLVIMLYDSFAVLALLIVTTALVMLLGFREITAFRDPLYTLILFAVWFLYLAWCWRSGGMTVGMRAWRVLIVDDRGNRPGWTRCSVRFLASLLSAAVLGMGFIWPLFDAKKRSWHDILSNTRLVRF